jgi:molecular chaperone DnaK
MINIVKEKAAQNESQKDIPPMCPIPQNIVLCIDLSRSMRGYLEEVKNVVRDFVMSVADENTKFGLIGFGDKVGIMRDMTTDPNTIVTALEGLKVNVYGRGTDASPMGTASSMMANRPGGKMIVILTDGIWGKRDFAVSEALTCRNSKIAVVGVGIGEADVSFLKQISTVEEGAMFTTLDRLGETFSTIATAISTGSMGLRESAGAGGARLGAGSRKCPKCGAGLRQGEKVCQRCGFEFKEEIKGRLR